MSHPVNDQILEQLKEAFDSVLHQVIAGEPNSFERMVYLSMRVNEDVILQTAFENLPEE